MPAVLPNTTTTDAYPVTGGAQLGLGDIFGSGFFVVANAAVFGEYFHGLRGQATPSDEIYLPPGTYPLTGTPKDPLGGIRFRSAVIGVPAQVFGVLYYPDEASLLASSEFTAAVAPNGGISGGSGTLLTGTVNAAGNVVSGTGFSSVLAAAGTYTITFTKPFATPPTVALVGNVAALTSNAWAISVPTINGFTVFSQTGGIGPVNAGFSFLVSNTA